MILNIGLADNGWQSDNWLPDSSLNEGDKK